MSAAFNRDGDRIVSAGVDGTIRVWDAIGGEQLVVLERFGAAGGAAFAPDGQSVLSYGVDNRRHGVLKVTVCDVCGTWRAF